MFLEDVTAGGSSRNSGSPDLRISGRSPVETPPTLPAAGRSHPGDTPISVGWQGLEGSG
jgi:hypothetical protein